MNTVRFSQLALPIGVVSIVAMLVVPMPSAMLDILIACNITGAVLLVLVSMYVRRPLDFSSFPSLLLVATLFRLALNISATRLVLSKGFAGNVIGAFGHFVIGGSLVVGLVIFVILLVIQFIVITNGAGRVAEVGARFTLDAMPGKQMAIDADLNAGLIDEITARKRRSEIASEADFYGAMDGATRFVKGDAIAAILITAINLIGGFAIGVVSHHLPVSEALSRYSLLSVGDGLVSQIPALLLSVATGLIVTRASDADDMGTVVSRQIGAQRRAVQIAGGAAVALCIVPGLPKLPFLLVGSGLLLMATRLKTTVETDTNLVPADGAAAVADAQNAEDAGLGSMVVDPLELALAPDLIALVDGPGADLLDRVRGLRRSLAGELGLVMPPVRTRDNVALPMSTYAIHINGVEVSRGQAPPGMLLAIGDGVDGLPGRAAQDPVFGLAGKWIAAELRAQAEMLGATVVDRSSLIITHLSEAVRQNSSRLLGREEVAAATRALKRTHPTVVEDLTPALLTLGEVQRVLHALLDEGVSIRDLVRIYEALSLAAKSGTDPDRLIEAARASLAPAIVAQHADDGRLDVLTIDAKLQQSMVESIRPGEGGSVLVLPPGLAEAVVASIAEKYRTECAKANKPVLVCAAQIRGPLRRLVRLTIPEVPILSYTELTAGSVAINAIGIIDDVLDSVP